MSLAQQIAARMLAKKSTAAAPSPRVVSPPAGHTSPQAYNPPPVPMAERRRRIAAGHARRSAPGPAQPGSTRLEPPQPVRTSAPIERQVDAQIAAELARRAQLRRPELEVDLVQGLQALPLPAAPPASSAPAPVARGRGSCFAIDAETGRQCRLPAHPESPDRHRHERGPFFRLLQAGAVPRLHQVLDAAAMASTEASEVFAGHGHASSPGERKTRKDAGQRKSAHAGDSTSTGIKSIDTNPEVSP